MVAFPFLPGGLSRYRDLTNMNQLLETISSLYLNKIPDALSRLPANQTFYAGFIPYFGWEAEPEDYAEHGRTIYILNVERLSEINKQTTDANEASRLAYGWGEFIGGRELTIDSQELHESLLRWYTHQIDQDESPVLLNQIGGAIASACRKLNGTDWDNDRVTPDFVVFTACLDDEEHDVKLSDSVPGHWLKSKMNDGMFQWLANS
ncbi:hypothetical protein SH528x_003584 [Novipirellula sp. SH528]|uniref:hypothetical protein n=1 Tax=Novipirellula sp. SH528 TaxID=3454466 RepID=UPI003F9EBC21